MEPGQVPDTFQVQTWMGVIAICVPTLSGAFVQYLRYRAQREHRAAVMALAAGNPGAAMAQLERMGPPPPGVSASALVLLILGTGMAVLSLLASPSASAAVSAPERCRPACTGSQTCVRNVCTDVARAPEAEHSVNAFTDSRWRDEHELFEECEP